MLLSSLPDLIGSRFTLTYEPGDTWIKATWRGYTTDIEAMREAECYLGHLARLSVPGLLNDSQEVHGPWFNSLLWLESTWLPHALHLGLRHMAHVMKPDTPAYPVGLSLPNRLAGQLDFQLFEDLATAQEWLRSR